MSRNGSLKLVGVAVCLAALSLSDIAAAGTLGPPPSAQPGQCWGEVSYPGSSETIREKVLVSEGRVQTRIIPGLVRRTTKRTLVAPQRTVTVPGPATYRNDVSYVMKPAVARVTTTPATWRVEKEKVLVEAGHAEWKRMDAASIARGEAKPGQTIVSPTGEVMCRIWIPDRYETREQRGMVSPARTTRVMSGPRKVRVVKRVLIKAGAPVVRVVPAVYRTQTSTTVLRAARKERIETAAVYKTVERRVGSAGRAGWAQVFCGGPLVPAFIQQMQLALNARGYDAGPPDGYARPQTYAALGRFQASKGMGQGQVTIEAARALGIW